MAESSLSDPHHHDDLPAVFLGWNMDELKALGLALAALLVWIGATALFGFGGLIIIALILVATVLAAIVVVSQG